MYTITMKRKLFGIFPITKKLKNVRFHNFPTEFNNNSFLLVVHVDESRELYNMTRYYSIHFPRECFFNNTENPQQSNIDNSILNKI